MTKIKNIIFTILIIFLLTTTIIATASADDDYGQYNGGDDYGQYNGGDNYGPWNGGDDYGQHTGGDDYGSQGSGLGQLISYLVGNNPPSGNNENNDNQDTGSDSGNPFDDETNYPAEWDDLEDQTIDWNSPDGTVVYQDLKEKCSDEDTPMKEFRVISDHENYWLYFESNDLLIKNLAEDYYGSESVVVECNKVKANFNLIVQVPGGEFPTANANGPYYGFVNEEIEFDASGSTDNGEIVAYDWKITDANNNPVASFSGEEAEVIFTQVGTYTVVLTVTDNDGLQATATTSAYISQANGEPTANFKYSPLNPTTEDEIQFEDTSSDEDGEIVDWEWDFDDGTTSESKNPEHQFEEDGNYYVTLTVWDNDGASDSLTRLIRVGEPSVELSQRTIFSRIRFYEYANAGDTLELSVELFNDGTYDMEDVIVTAFIGDLGVWRTAGPLDIDDGEREMVKIYLDLPADAALGDYDIRFSASNDNFKNTEYREVTII